MSSSTAIRVFRGCNALLAAAKSSTAFTSTAVKPKSKAKAKVKPKADADAIKPKRNVNRTAGILKPIPISPVRGSFLGAAQSSLAEAVKQIWAHIKLHDLQVLPNGVVSNVRYSDVKLYLSVVQKYFNYGMESEVK